MSYKPDDGMEYLIDQATGPSEYVQAAFCCEMLLVHESALSEITIKSLKKQHPKRLTTSDGKIAEQSLSLFRQFRPEIEDETGALERAENQFREIVHSLDGLTPSDALRRIRGQISECLCIIKTWIASLGEFVEHVTKSPAHDWLELADRVLSPSAELLGENGSIEALQRVAKMLDNVVAIAFSEVEIETIADEQDQLLAHTNRQNKQATIAEQETSLREFVGSDTPTCTVVFTDIVESTRLNTDLGDYEYNKIIRSHYKRVRNLIQSNDGFEVKTMGDGFLILFKSCVHAVVFAHNLALNSGHQRIEVRIGLHCGIVSIEGDDVFGQSVTIARRITDGTARASIRVSQTVREQILQHGHTRLSSVQWRKCSKKLYIGRSSVAIWELPK